MELEIDEDNYYDYFILSMEFNNKLLYDHLSKSEYNDIKNISFLKKAISKENTDTDYCEEYISEHLDFFLRCYKEKMSKILPTTLYNIFHHQNRVLDNQECAYQFIKYVLSKSENDTNANICILLGTLDGEKISSESLQECLSKSDERYGFTPKIRSSFIDSFNENLSNFKASFNEFKSQQHDTNIEMKQQQQNLLNEIKNQNQQIINLLKQQQIDLLNDFKEQNQNSMNEMKKQIIIEVKQQQQDLLNDVKEQNQNSMNEMKKQILTEIRQQKQAVDEIKKQFLLEFKQQQESISQLKNDLEQKIIQIQNSIDSISKKSIEIENEIKPMSDSVKKIEGNIQQISTTSDETQNKISIIVDKLNQVSQKCLDIDKCIQQIPNKINSIEDEAKKIFNKVCINLGISLASIKSFNGIIRQLTDECGGNVSDKNIVNVTASSEFECNKVYYAKYAVDFDNDEKFFGSKNEQNSWLLYDFKNKKVYPICYLIKVRCNDPKPKNWVIEGSNSGSSDSWTLLDERKDYSFDEQNLVQMFVLNKRNEFYRYLRIRQTGLSSFNDQHLCIVSLEYFGSIQ